MRSLVISLTSALLLVACTDDAEPSTIQEHGLWAVDSALRGGEITNTLDEAQFKFDTATSTFTTNLADGKSYPYLRTELELQIEGSDLFEAFTIVSGTDTTLQLQTTIQQYPFLFGLYRLN